MLRTSQAQTVETTPLSLRTIRNAGFQVLEIPNIAVTSLVFPGKNNSALFTDFPTSKVKVRQGLSYAIDREQIITTILEGLGTVPARHGIAPSNVGYDPSWKPDPYDPNRAKQLLAEAGYPNGFDLTVHSFPYAAIPWYPQVTEAIAGFWSEIGVRANINSTEFGSLVQTFRRRPQDRAIVGTTFLLPTFIRQEPLSGLAGYYTRTAPINLLPAPDKMDDLFFKAQTTLDPNERVALTRQIVQLAYDEYVTAPIALSGALYGAVKGLTGWKPIQSTPGLGFIAEHLQPRP